MRYNLVGILLGSCIVMFLWFSGDARAIVDRFAPHDTFALALSKVQPCMKVPDSATCVRPVVAQMLKEKNGSQIMDTLATRLPPQECHYVGHVVGQQLYAQSKDVEGALAQCDHSCDSACIHGVIGQAFAVALGHPDTEDQNFDLEHLSADDISKVGKRLCSSAGACHGVGHVLFQAYKQFAPAFSMCRRIGGASSVMCYNGVTMEYADILSMRNMRAVPGVAYPLQKDFSSLCIFPRIDETRSCFRYFPRIVEEALKRDSIPQKEAKQDTQKICESYASTDDRVSCFAGIGTHDAYAVLTDTVSAVHKCEGFQKVLDQASCVLGIVSVATGDRQKKIASFCGAQNTVGMQAFCYQGLFSTLNGGGATFSVPFLCGKNNPVCEEGAVKYKLDPWLQIRKNFAG